MYRGSIAGEAAHTILRFRGCLDRNATWAEAQFIIFLDLTSRSIQAERKPEDGIGRFLPTSIFISY